MDIISQFSDDLLIRILSLVPTKHAMTTCLLSKRWQFLWSLVPRLEYDDSRYSDDNYATFTQFVYRSLMSNKAPVIYSLDLKLGPKCQAVDLGIWIDTAVSHRVRGLGVDIRSSEKGSISLPSSMYTCETLETLILENHIRLDILSSVCLPSLKTLYLSDVDYADNGSLSRLLSGCPKLVYLAVTQKDLDVALVRSISLPSSMYTCETLETLILEYHIRLDILSSVCLPSLKLLHLTDVDYADNGSLSRLLSGCPKLVNLTVNQKSLDVPLVLPSLRILKMINEAGDEKGGGFVIDAPSLVNFHIEDDVLYDYHRIEYMPELKEARVDMTHKVNHKFLKAFTSVRSLYLCLSFSEVLSPCGMIFHNLVNLELCTCAQGWWDLLSHMLQESPNLGALKLNDEHALGFPSIETPDCWKPPSSVPKCLLYSLDFFEWNCYKGRRGDSKMATYLVAHATRLKTAVFSPESDDVAARYMMLQDLASVATPSPWFQLFFD